MVITDPFNPLNMISFVSFKKPDMWSNQPMIRFDPTVHISEPAQDTVPDNSLFKKWDCGGKIVQGDTLKSDHAISILLLKDKHFRLTINNKKTEGTWEIHKKEHTLVLTFKGEEHLCQFDLFKTGTRGFAKSQEPELLLTFLMPGENKVATYVFK